MTIKCIFLALDLCYSKKVHAISSIAYAFASTFQLKELLNSFPGAEVHLHKDSLVVQYPPKEEYTPICIAFDFGALVFIGVDPLIQKQVVQEILSQKLKEPHEPFTEDLLLELRKGLPPEVQFDRVFLSELTLPRLKILALLLAQSAAMDYYHQDIQEIFTQTERITLGLQKKGTLPGHVKDLLKFIGICITTKNDILATLSLFDKPDPTWEDPDLDRLYIDLRNELEIHDRFRALESKLRMIQDNLVLLVELSKHRSSWRLELIVVLLILFEVLLSLWQMWKGH